MMSSENEMYFRLILKGRLDLVYRNALAAISLISLLAISSQSFAAEGTGSWVQVSLGLNGMAMDDINETDFRWHEDSPDGFNLGEVNSGTALSFGVGYDMSPLVGYGLFWEHQYASTDGMDQEMKADVNLAADIFTGRLNLNFLRRSHWRLGVAGSLGFLVVGGSVDKTTDGASYGKTDLSGNCWALEGMANLEIVVGESTIVQVTTGWRQADVSSFKNASATVSTPDGGDMSMDYSGLTLRVGMKYRFGSMAEQTTPDIN